MDQVSLWYASLDKPFFSPPSWVFGPVWFCLYILIFISFSSVLWLFLKRKIPFFVALPFFINISANLAFAPLQFQLQNNWLSLLDILIILGTLIWAMKVIYPLKRWIFIFQIPYLLWVAFATLLQISITFLNL